MKRQTWIWLFCFVLIIHPSVLSFAVSLFFCNILTGSCNYGIFNYMNINFLIGAGSLIHTLLIFGTAAQVVRLGKPADFSKPDMIVRSFLILAILIFILNRTYIESFRYASEYAPLILSALKTVWIFNSIVSAGFFFYLSLLLKNEFFKIPSILIIGTQMIQFLNTDRGSIYLSSSGAILTSLSIAYAVWNSKVVPERLYYLRIYSIILIIKYFISYSFSAALSYFGSGSLNSFYGTYSFINSIADFIFQAALFNAFWYFSEKEILSESKV